jgi:hypothetical protein
MRAIAHGGQFVSNLLERGPDVVEELDFDYRPEASLSHSDGPPDDVGFG